MEHEKLVRLTADQTEFWCQVHEELGKAKLPVSDSGSRLILTTGEIDNTPVNLYMAVSENKCKLRKTIVMYNFEEPIFEFSYYKSGIIQDPPKKLGEFDLKVLELLYLRVCQPEEAF